MRIVEIILDEDLVEDLNVVAEILGVQLEMLVVMACQNYIRSINERGFPHITGLYLRAEESGEEGEGGEADGV